MRATPSMSSSKRTPLARRKKWSIWRMFRTWTSGRLCKSHSLLCCGRYGTNNGSPRFEDEDLQTHHTITNKLGYTNIMAVVAPGAEEGKKRKRKGVGRGSLKRRRAFKWGGGTKRGPGGRFVRSGMEDDPIVLE
jgi:hypothetical protein